MIEFNIPFTENSKFVNHDLEIGGLKFMAQNLTFDPPIIRDDIEEQKIEGGNPKHYRTGGKTLRKITFDSPLYGNPFKTIKLLETISNIRVECVCPYVGVFDCYFIFTGNIENGSGGECYRISAEVQELADNKRSVSTII